MGAKCIFLFFVLLHTNFVFSQSTSDSTSSNFNFRSCLQTALLLGLRNINNTDPSIDLESLKVFNPSASTSKIPTELGTEAEADHSLSDIDGIGILNTSVDSLTSFSEDDIPGMPMTKSTARENIRYLLFTSRNKEQFQVMPEDGSVTGTNWNPNKKTKVLIHGLTSTQWFSPITNIWTQHIFEIKDAYLNARLAPGHNVIVVDWTSLSTVPLSRYAEAAQGTHPAGVDVAQFLMKLKRSNNIQSWNDVHLLGHSLGAHVAGIAGDRLQKMGRANILPRITGLDPAGLCFDTRSGLVEDPAGMLDSSDAKFVDIVHTNMGNVITSAAGRYGSEMQTGHVDFYPNGGEQQGGCNFFQDRALYCSHQKSVVYYAKSITERIISCPCNNWDSYRSLSCQWDLKSGGEYFGEFCDVSARGKYFLEIDG